MADNIVAIMDITITQEKDKAACHTKDSKIKKHSRLGMLFLHATILQEDYKFVKGKILCVYKSQVLHSLLARQYSVQYYRA